MLGEMVVEIRNFPGLRRKFALRNVLEALNMDNYDDAGLLRVGEFKIVVTVDGIVESIVKEDPWIAGYYSVITNVNDIVAKGGKPVGYFNVISSNSSQVREKIAEGIRFGLKKYRLKNLKGHTCPDTEFHIVDAGAIGVTRKFLSSDSARYRDVIIAAFDLDGKFNRRGWVKAYDSTFHKSPSQIFKRLKAMMIIAEKNLANASKDISGPGIIGTIAMMCEASKVGAEINLENIPRPNDVKLKDWLITFPSTGFILTSSKPESCIKIFKNHGLQAAIIGNITRDKKVILNLRNESAVFLDLNKESIFGKIN